MLLKQILRHDPGPFIIEDDCVDAIAGAPYFGLFDATRSPWTVVRSLCKALVPDL